MTFGMDNVNGYDLVSDRWIGAFDSWFSPKVYPAPMYNPWFDSLGGWSYSGAVNILAYGWGSWTRPHTVDQRVPVEYRPVANFELFAYSNGLLDEDPVVVLQDLDLTYIDNLVINFGNYDSATDNSESMNLLEVRWGNELLFQSRHFGNIPHRACLVGIQVDTSDLDGSGVLEFTSMRQVNDNLTSSYLQIRDVGYVVPPFLNDETQSIGRRRKHMECLQWQI